MMDCFGVQLHQFGAGQTIFEYGSGNDQVGILQNGKASLVRMDQEGSRTVLEHLEPGSVFGEMMAFPCVGTTKLQNDVKRPASITAVWWRICLD